MSHFPVTNYQIFHSAISCLRIYLTRKETQPTTNFIPPPAKELDHDVPWNMVVEMVLSLRGHSFVLRGRWTFGETGSASCTALPSGRPGEVSPYRMGETTGCLTGAPIFIAENQWVTGGLWSYLLGGFHLIYKWIRGPSCTEFGTWGWLFHRMIPAIYASR